MTILAAALGLSTIVFFVLYACHANRAANLQYLLDMERAITVELVSQLAGTHDRLAEVCVALDDAQRNAAYWQTRTDALLCENSTLVVDLCHTDCRNSYLESLHAQRKGETAGVVLTSFVLNPKRKMQTMERIAP